MIKSYTKRKNSGALSKTAEDIRGMEQKCKDEPWKQALYGSVRKGIEWWVNLEEPRRSGCVANIVTSMAFNSIVVIVILANAISMTLTTNYEVVHLKDDTSNALEWFFLTFYSLELALRMAVHKFFFFVGADCGWNIFDLCLVVVAVCDTVASLVLFQFGVDGGGASGSAQTLRILRTVRALRLLRLLHFLCPDLKIMLNSVIGSLANLFWAFTLLTFTFYVFGLIFVQTLLAYMLNQGEGLDPGLHAKIIRVFGSVQGAMLTLYRSVLHGEDWDEYYQVLTQASALGCALFLFFVGFVQLSLLNTLTAVFLRNALELAKPNEQTQMQEERLNRAGELEELCSLCKSFDVDDNGVISVDQLRKQLESDRSHGLQCCME